MSNVCWKDLINNALNGDEITSCTLSEEELQVIFNDGYGGSQGKPFMAWSDEYVYFPVVYDGAEWVGRAPRNPCNEATDHVGGE